MATKMSRNSMDTALTKIYLTGVYSTYSYYRVNTTSVRKCSYSGLWTKMASEEAYHIKRRAKREEAKRIKRIKDGKRRGLPYKRRGKKNFIIFCYFLIFLEEARISNLDYSGPQPEDFPCHDPLYECRNVNVRKTTHISALFWC